MTALSWDEICKRASENNRTLICEVDKRYDKRYFKTRKERYFGHQPPHAICDVLFFGRLRNHFVSHGT